MDVIQKRREITKFQGKPIERVKLEVLLNAGYLAPTGNNLPSRELVLVTEQKMLQHLAQATPYVPWLRSAQAAIVITARPDVSKYWLQDASISSAFIWLTATDIGLGAAFGAIYHGEDAVESKKREDFVRQALSIPDDRRIISILGLGYPSVEPPAKQLPEKSTIIHYEAFNK